VLARLPDEVQSRVIEGFQPEEEVDGGTGSDNLFVAGLPVNADEGLLRGIFSQHGTVLKCRVLANRGMWQTDAAALVQMAEADQADSAISALNQATPEGCQAPLTVRYATSQGDRGKSKGKGKAKVKGKANHSKAVVVFARSLQAKSEEPPSGSSEVAAKPSRDAEKEAWEAREAMQAKEAKEAQAWTAASSSSSGPMKELPTGKMIPGTVKFWNDGKGYGFLLPEGGGPDVFVHRNALKDGSLLLRDAKVTFEVEWDEAGWRYRAKEVVGASSANPGPPPEQRPPPERPPLPEWPLPPPSAQKAPSKGGGPPPHLERWVPPAALPDRAQDGAHRGFVKAWFEERGYGFIAPEMGGADIYVHRSRLSDGSYLVKGTSVAYILHWDPARDQWVTKECWGAQGERQELPVLPSKELQTFAERWSLDREALAVVATLPEEVQLHILADYQPADWGAEAEGEGSRSLFVAGLPMDATDELVKRIFSEHGSVDWCKVLSNRNAAHQTDRAALVNMATLQQAAGAIRELNQAVPQGCQGPLSVKHAAGSREGKGKGSGKGKVVNHSKAVVMFARSLQAKMGIPRAAAAGVSQAEVESIGDKEGAPPAASSSASADTAEIPCGIMLPGIVKFWHEAKGYGFINPTVGGPDVFVHRRQLTDGARLHRNAPVTFTAEWDYEGWRYRAAVVVGATDEPERPPQPLLEPAAPCQGGRPNLPAPLPPPPPPPSPASNSRPGGLHAPQALPPSKRQKHQQLQPEVPLVDLVDDGPRPPDTPPPPMWVDEEGSYSAPVRPPAPRQRMVLTPTAKVRPTSSAAYSGREEAEARPSSAPTFQAGVYAEQPQEQQSWGEGGQWPNEGFADQHAPADASWW